MHKKPALQLQYRGLVEAGWWVVVTGDRVCGTLRQMESGSFPSERLAAVSFIFFSIFLLLPDWLLLPFTRRPLFTSALFSLTSDDKPSVESHFPFLFSFFSSFLRSSLFPSFLFPLQAFFFYHRDKMSFELTKVSGFLPLSKCWVWQRSWWTWGADVWQGIISVDDTLS